jgi:NTE family protein
MSKNALVISGGGCKGAFAVGVLKYIYTNVDNLDFQIFCGTSTGALILPLAVINEIPTLSDIYSNSFTNDIIKQRLITDAAMDGYLYNSTPLKELVEKTITGNVFDKIMNSGKEFYISTVCLQSGKVTYFTNSDVLYSNSEYDVIKIGSTERGKFIDAIRASAHQPVFMEPVQIGNYQYVDGGVREYLPVRAALDSGADKIYSIILAAEYEIVSTDHYKDLIGIAKRTIDLFSEDVSANDYKIAKMLNSAKVLDWIRPDEKLAENGLAFDPINMRASMEKGFAKAQEWFNSHQID